ncbi:MAG: nucleotide exchange factor GrpE [Desulfohalobiaceae bacterium]|nr:nucleotide exchange factor GrpE [Desulfohalobiaceae bacterium]
MNDAKKQSQSRNQEQDLAGNNEESREENQTQTLADSGESGQEPTLSDEELVSLCKEKVCPECPVTEEKDQELMRAKADVDNYRKRLSREKEQFVKYACQGLLEDMIPVIDNLDLALEHGQKIEACKDLIQGVELTRKIFLETLEKHGFEPIESQTCQPFDPAWHEAMGEVEDEDTKPGDICQVLQKGYKLKERVLRPAKVMLSKK